MLERDKKRKDMSAGEGVDRGVEAVQAQLGLRAGRPAGRAAGGQQRLVLVREQGERAAAF